tara:strand:- start:311 stop:586 length:276 start_codon:yes stop_codon:yes gene_type:complete
MLPDMSKVTKNKDGTPRKKGSGRTKGATSLSNVRFGTLKEYLVNDDMIVPVSRVWLKKVLGIEVSAPKTKKIKAEKEESTKVEYSLTTFED